MVALADEQLLRPSRWAPWGEKFWQLLGLSPVLQQLLGLGLSPVLRIVKCWQTVTMNGLLSCKATQACQAKNLPSITSIAVRVTELYDSDLSQEALLHCQIRKVK